jgi:hypothetical protein
MPEQPRRLILASGEKYVKPAEKKGRGRAAEMPRTYEEARIHIKGQINSSLQRIAALPVSKKLNEEAVLCLRLHPDMTAKTYDPRAVFAQVASLENIGSRNYQISLNAVAKTKRVKSQIDKEINLTSARLVFVRSTTSGFRSLVRALDASESLLPSDFKQDIQRIETFDLLLPSEQLLGFPAEWSEGRVEIVLHPSQYPVESQINFLKSLFGRDWESHGKTKVATYDLGPTFVSCRLNRAELDNLSGSNPLRTVHPLIFGGLQDLRNAPDFPAPLPSVTQSRSVIRIGMFDGGIDVNNPLLKGHVEEDTAHSINSVPDPRCVAHGTAVAGAILYGPLNNKDTKKPLAAPSVSVISFRALPTSNPADIDLYESIDVIENTIPARKDIQVYNLSFGPRGAILEDAISRFTYVLDSLAAKHKVTFFVAVGNDGEAGTGLDRIQAPSDLVNGMGIGAFTERDGKSVHAPYSCKGPGRECAKVKPDLVAFGGCDQQPIHLVSSLHGNKILSRGTSFASPAVASLAGQLAGTVETGSALLARALLIHTALHPDGTPDDLLGHGIVQPNLDAILKCEKEVSILFQSSIETKKMVRLPIMLPPNLINSGKIKIRWTVAALPQVNLNHPADYTGCCIEDTFYPDVKKFKFTSPNKSDKPKELILHIDDDAAQITALLAKKWKKSAFPVSKTGNQYTEEKQKRAMDCKWEPIVRRSISMNAESLNEPFLILHAIPRNGTIGRLDYAAVVTIAAPKFKGDLYDAVLRRFNALQPISLRTETELRVRL